MADSDSNLISPVPDPELEDDGAALMYVRCAVCGEWLDVKPGKLNWVSHGICPACHSSEMARIGMILEERRKQRERTDCGLEQSPPDAVAPPP